MNAGTAFRHRGCLHRASWKVLKKRDALVTAYKSDIFHALVAYQDSLVGHRVYRELEVKVLRVFEPIILWVIELLIAAIELQHLCRRRGRTAYDEYRNGGPDSIVLTWSWS